MLKDITMTHQTYVLCFQNKDETPQHNSSSPSWKTSMWGSLDKQTNEAQSSSLSAFTQCPT